MKAGRSVGGCRAAGENHPNPGGHWQWGPSEWRRRGREGSGTPPGATGPTLSPAPRTRGRRRDPGRWEGKVGESRVQSPEQLCGIMQSYNVQNFPPPSPPWDPRPGFPQGGKKNESDLPPRHPKRLIPLPSIPVPQMHNPPCPALFSSSGCSGFPPRGIRALLAWGVGCTRTTPSEQSCPPPLEPPPLRCKTNSQSTSLCTDIHTRRLALPGGAFRPATY